MLHRLLLAVLLSLPVAGVAQTLTLPELPGADKLGPASELGVRDNHAGLAPGAPVPDFSAQTAAGEPVQWRALLGQKPLLVIFYRGGWCPYCNLQIRQLTEAYGEFAQRGVELVLISADKVEAAALAQKQYDIPFPVLSDPALAAHEAFNVVMSLTPELYETYKIYGIDVEQWSGQTHHQFALASAFLVSPEGRVQWAHVSADYKQRPSVAQLLSVLDGQGQR